MQKKADATCMSGATRSGTSSRKPKRRLRRVIRVDRPQSEDMRALPPDAVVATTARIYGLRSCDLNDLDRHREASRITCTEQKVEHGSTAELGTNSQAMLECSVLVKERERHGSSRLQVCRLSSGGTTKMKSTTSKCGTGSFPGG